MLPPERMCSALQKALSGGMPGQSRAGLMCRGPVRELFLLRATACTTRGYGLSGRVQEWTAGCLGLRHGAAGSQGFGGLLATGHWASFGAGAGSRACGHARTRACVCRCAGAWGGIRLRIGGGAGHHGAHIGADVRAIVALGVNGRLRGQGRTIDIAGQQAGAGGQAGDDQYGGNHAL